MRSLELNASTIKLTFFHMGVLWCEEFVDQFVLQGTWGYYFQIFSQCMWHSNYHCSL